MRIEGKIQTPEGNTPEAGNLFETVLRVAQKQQGNDDKPSYRMASDNEVWPPVRDTEIVEIPEEAKTKDGATDEDTIAFKADGETVVVKRDVNPRLFDYIEGIKGMAGAEINTLKQRDERILRNDETVPLQDLKDITSWLSNDEILTFTAKDKDGNAIAISKELTPDFFEQVKALHEGNDKGFALKTDDNLFSGTDLAKAEILPPDENNGFIGLTMDGNKIHVSAEVSPAAYDQVTSLQASHADIEASKKDGYKVAGPEDYPHDDEIVKWGMPDEFDNGIVRFETENGDKFVVSEHVNKPLYDRIVALGEGTQAKDVDKIRDEYGLPSADELDPLRQETDVLIDEKDESKGKYTVSELATKTLVEEYQKGVDDGSIGKDDPRAKLVRALEAQSAYYNGRGITGYEETKGLFGGTWRESDDKQTQLNKHDLQDIIDGNALDTSMEELFSNETISDDYSRKMEEALGKIDREGLEQKLDDLVFGKDSKYMEYIAELKEQGLTHAAQADIASVVQSLSILDPEKGKQAAAQLQTDALTMDLDALVANPDTITEENKTQATKDLFGLLKSIFKSDTLDLPRRTIDTIEKFIDGFINGKVPEKDVMKAVNGAAQEAAANGGHIPKESLDKYNAMLPMADREGFAGFVGKLNSMGILGSLGGGVSLISGIYQLAGRGGKLADTPIERLAVAKDFISFVGATSHFATLGDSIAKSLGGEGKMASLLGLDKTVPEIWGKNGINGQVLADTVPKNAYTLPEIELQDFDRFTADTTREINQAADRIAKGEGVNGSKFIENFDPADIDGVQSTFDNQAKAAGLSSLDNLKNIGKTVARVLGATADVAGGVADVVLGAFTIKDAIRNDSDLGKAAGSLQVVAGATGLAAGGAGLAAAFGIGGAAMGAAAGPLFLVGVALAAIGGIIGYFLDHEKKQKATNAEGDWYKDLARDGLLQEDWGDKVEYARYSSYRYGERDAPDDQSIYEFQEAEWEHFKDTQQDDGSSSNRLDEELHVDKEMAGYQREFYDENRKVIDTIRERWDDWNGSDSIVSDKDLRKYAADGNRSQEDRDAAQFLLDNRGFFDLLDISAHDNGKDGKISNNDLNAWLGKVGA